MTITTHELAKKLLEKDDKPIYIKETYEFFGEVSFGFSTIVDINENEVEDGYTFKIEYLKGTPKSIKYELGDAFVFIYNKSDDKHSELLIKLDDIIFMLLNDEDFYYNHNIGLISFNSELKSNEIRNVVDNKKLKIVIGKPGFSPEIQLFNLEEAKLWYKNNIIN